LATGCNLPGTPKPEHRPEYPEQVAKFEQLFNKNCRGCHGQDGKMGPAPPLNDALFRAGISEKEIRTVLTSGRKGTLMPAFLKENGGLLTAAQIDIMVNELKGIPYQVVQEGEGETVKLRVTQDEKGKSPAWGTSGESPRGAPPYPPPAGETGDKDRGMKVFARACASCHGEDGKAGAGQGSESEGKGQKSLRINDPAFLTLLSDQALRRLIITGRPDLGMPDYAGSKERGGDFKPLSSPDVADLVALLGYWRVGGVVNGR